MTDSHPSNSFAVQVDGQTAESWSAVLAQFDDASVYQSWAYGAVRWGQKNLSHLVLRREGHPVAAAQLRIARLPLLPAGIAYLRWGPLCQRRGEAVDAGLLEEMMRRLQAEYGGKRGLSLQVLPNAYAGDERGTLHLTALARAGLKPDPALSGYHTVLVPLTDPPELMRKHLDQKWRNQLNRAEKNGLVFEASETAAAYQEFLQLYAVMWGKKQFETSVDVEEFGRIQAQLGPAEKMQIFLARKDGTAVGALVCSLMGDTGLYVLGATNDQARELKAAYFLQWQAMMWFKDRGARWYDLGGIDPVANPGGYHFKSGFGGTEKTHVPPHAGPAGALGKLILGGVGWLRRRRSARPAPASPAPGLKAAS